MERQEDEAQHVIRLTRVVAISDREITWDQYSQMDAGKRKEICEQTSVRPIDDSEPVFGVDWFDSVNFCHWLSEAAKFETLDQCYENRELREKGLMKHLNFQTTQIGPCISGEKGFGS